ncbi:hypothetical protein BDZ45DRAFT_742202 [Acephala macrosclerotiorum]|nr:hypothetical protein BDZ45DRAFT_742202 [Acephala macrosclerotiorum]
MAAEFVPPNKLLSLYLPSFTSHYWGPGLSSCPMSITSRDALPTAGSKMPGTSLSATVYTRYHSNYPQDVLAERHRSLLPLKLFPLQVYKVQQPRMRRAKLRNSHIPYNMSEFSSYPVSTLPAGMARRPDLFSAYIAGLYRKEVQEHQARRCHVSRKSNLPFIMPINSPFQSIDGLADIAYSVRYPHENWMSSATNPHIHDASEELSFSPSRGLMRDRERERKQKEEEG